MADLFRLAIGLTKMGGWRRTSGTVAEGGRNSRSARDIAHKGARRALKAELQEQVEEVGAA